MKKNLQDIDKLFKAALNDHTERPPDAVWDAIDQRLDKNKVVDINRKYVQLKRVAVALLILLLGFGAYTLNHWTKISNQTKTDSTSNSKVNNPISKTVTSVDVPVKTGDTTATTAIPNVTKGDSVAAVQDAPDLSADVKQKDGNVLNASGKNTVTRLTNNASVGTKPNSISEPAISVAQAAGQLARVPKIKQPVDQANADDAILTTDLAAAKNIVVHPKKQHTTITNGSVAEDSLSDTNRLAVETRSKKNTILHPGREEKGIDYTRSSLPITDLSTKPLYDATLYKNDRTKNILAHSFLPSGLTLPLRPAKRLSAKNRGGLSATLFYSPNIASNLLKEEGEEHRPPLGGPVPPDHDDKDKIRQSEYRQSSYSIGLLLDYNLSKHWSIQSGVAYTTRKILINPKTIYAGKDDNGEVRYRFNCSSGYTYFSSSTATNPAVGDTLQVLQASNTLKYMSVPLAIKYHYYWNKLDFFAAAGTSFNILSKGEIVAQTGTVYNKDVSTTTKISGLKSSYFSGNLGVGLSYALSRGIALSFMPSYNFALNSSTRDATVKTYPNNFSLAAGLRFKL